MHIHTYMSHTDEPWACTAGCVYVYIYVGVHTHVQIYLCFRCISDTDESSVCSTGSIYIRYMAAAADACMRGPAGTTQNNSHGGRAEEGT